MLWYHGSGFLCRQISRFHYHLPADKADQVLESICCHFWMTTCWLDERRTEPLCLLRNIRGCPDVSSCRVCLGLGLTAEVLGCAVKGNTGKRNVTGAEGGSYLLWNVLLISASIGGHLMQGNVWSYCLFYAVLQLVWECPPMSGYDWTCQRKWWCVIAWVHAIWLQELGSGPAASAPLFCSEYTTTVVNVSRHL